MARVAHFDTEDQIYFDDNELRAIRKSGYEVVNLQGNIVAIPKEQSYGFVRALAEFGINATSFPEPGANQETPFTVVVEQKQPPRGKLQTYMIRRRA